MYKYRRFRTSITGKSMITEDYLKNFLVRKPTKKLDKMHPAAKRTYNKMIQEPQPLTYKLRDVPEASSDGYNEYAEPMGGTAHIPFHVQRTHTNNLPVYTQYKNSRTEKLTIVRLIRGDIEEFKKEVAKIVSNCEVTHQTGKVIVKGLHALKIKLWLRRLGF